MPAQAKALSRRYKAILYRSPTGGRESLLIQPSVGEEITINHEELVLLKELLKGEQTR